MTDEDGESVDAQGAVPVTDAPSAPAPKPEREMTDEEREQAAIRAELEEAGADFEEAENADQAPGLEVELSPEMQEYQRQLNEQAEQKKKEKLRGKTKH